jgi:hypothetical protein
MQLLAGMIRRRAIVGARRLAEVFGARGKHLLAAKRIDFVDIRLLESLSAPKRWEKGICAYH